MVHHHQLYSSGFSSFDGQPGPKPGTEVDPEPATPEIDPPIPPDISVPNII